ncbi:MAG: fatty acid desaturase [Chloroflexi bacterium]|nr:MAG: fatty acid desaturase [Chloroflexota bacterium]
MMPWKQAVAKYQEPMLRKSIWQVINTVVPYLSLSGLMIWTLHISYWLTLTLAVAVAGFLTRIFIIFHDWDGRGTGDIWTLTVQEYVEAPWWKRIGYRVFRNPFVLFIIAPLYLFLIHQRFPSRGVGKRERLGVHWTNGAILGIVVLMSLTVGIKAYLLVQLPVMAITGTVGLWLFYVQHQFEGVYWQRRKDWGFAEAALDGSSFYKLPRILQWFSGNIGFHHVHHLSPRIPNYNLESCHRADPLFQRVKPITLFSSLRSFTYRLWDEQRGRLIGYRRLRELRRQQVGPFQS